MMISRITLRRLWAVLPGIAGLLLLGGSILAGCGGTAAPAGGATPPPPPANVQAEFQRRMEQSGAGNGRSAPSAPGTPAGIPTAPPTSPPR